ncbi:MULTISPECIES: acyl carrier protein [unclassified Paenibacillus]|uniref:Acyl carrier protein n=1 Tax=Paenibacillus provencensis TaxID=441151 RepID=A0ABW3PV62_9BACL|nr:MULTISPECIES: acyl carrier protein [unclassified Paenibacillus]MCM3129668.1 acyl carrier protein [Paenibacillus sp. MER 78]SFS54534.1 acyl carrier protein [Paenibacillus sp. 453mf]
MEDIRNRIIEIVEEMTQESLSADALNSTFEELGIDSLMALELAVHLEREFGVQLTEGELGTLQHLQDIVDIADTRKE